MHRLLLFSILGVTSGCVHYAPAPISSEKNADEWQSRNLADPRLRAFIETAAPEAGLVWPRSSWDLNGLTLVGFYYNADLAVARAQWATATAGIKVAGSRPNPTVGVTPGYNFNAESGKSPWFPGLTIDLPIETAGKRGIRITRAERLALAARLNVTTAAWQLRGTLRSALLDFTAARQRLSLLQTQMEVQQRIVGLLQERQALGAASTTEVSTARIALARLQVDVSEAQRQRNEAQSRLAGSLGIPLAALDGVNLDLAPESKPTALDRAEMRRLALQRRSDIRAALADYDVSEAELQAEIAKQYPDLNLGTGYQWDQGENKWNLALSLEVPVFNRNQGAIAEAEAKRRESAAKFRALQAKISAEIDRAAAAQGLAMEQLARASDVNRALGAQVERMQTRLTAGDIDQLEFQTVRLEAATSAVTALDNEIRVTQAAGELENALQIPFPALSLIEKSTNAQSEKDKP